MSKVPLASMFSAAHVSKWDTLCEDTHIRATRQSGLVEGTVLSSLSDQPDSRHEERASSKSSNSENIIARRESCEITVRVAASVTESVSGRRSTGRSTTESRENMAVKTYTWVTLWFLVTAPVVLWDAGYCFMRPRSMVGGDLHWIWKPYSIYQNIDNVYGVKALEENNGFTNAQSLLNVVETAMNVAYVYLAYVSSWPGAPLIGFAAATMTFSKTVLYWAQEYYCSWCAAGHNTWDDYLLYWVLPNGLWLVFPSLILLCLGGDILNSLSIASQSARKAASGKTQ